MKLQQEKWITGSGTQITFGEIVSLIISHSQNSGKVYVGCDSHLKKGLCIFATAICLHGGSEKTSRYFFRREKSLKKSNLILRARINAEVERGLNVIFILMEAVPNAEIEMHIDIGRNVKCKTRSFVDAITGWVRSTGVPCKIKPDAWASASVADKHTK